jgi:hypothetical protein
MIKIRPADISDYEALVELGKSIGHPFGKSPAFWQRLHNEHPMASHMESALPCAWLLEDSKGNIAGHLGNNFSLWSHQGQRFLAANTNQWMVKPELRSFSLLLLKKFYSQKKVDFFVSTSVTNKAKDLYLALGALPIPLEHYQKPVFAITNHRGFAESAFKKKGLPLPKASGFLAGTGLALYDKIKTKPAYKTEKSNYAFEILTRFDERFDSFFDSLIEQQAEVITLWRSSRFLNWYFKDQLASGQAWIIACYKAEILVGYAVLVRKDRASIGLKRMALADLQAIENHPAVISGILNKAKEACAHQAIHLLEATGFSKAKREILTKSLNRFREYSHFPYYYKCNNTDLADTLRDSAAWDPATLDGLDSL